MDTTEEIPSFIKNIDTKKYTPEEIEFGLRTATGASHGEAYREATGYEGEYARQNGYKMAQKPHIQELVDNIKQYSTDIITDEFIKGGFLKEAIEAEHSRDRRGALESLAKIRGMYKDVIEQTTYTKTSDEELLDKIEKQLGPEARKRAAEEMGIDEP